AADRGWVKRPRGLARAGRGCPARRQRTPDGVDGLPEARVRLFFPAVPPEEARELVTRMGSPGRGGEVGEQSLSLPGREADGALPGPETRPEATEQRQVQHRHGGTRATSPSYPDGEGSVQAGFSHRCRRFFHALR